MSTNNKFLNVGSPLITTTQIYKGNAHIRVLNKEDFINEVIQPGAYARIHSRINENRYIVWVYDLPTHATIRMDVPLMMMGQLFAPKHHGLFPHFA